MYRGQTLTNVNDMTGDHDNWELSYNQLIAIKTSIHWLDDQVYIKEYIITSQLLQTTIK